MHKINLNCLATSIINLTITSSVLIKLYLTLILPILMYSSSVWDPYSIPNINKLEKVQHFALKLCSKNWTSDYPLLLQLFNLPSLSSRRTTSKLVLLYKFIFSKLYIPGGSFSFQNQSSYNLRSSHHLNLTCPSPDLLLPSTPSFPVLCPCGIPFPHHSKISTLQGSSSQIFLIYFKIIRNIAYMLFIFIHSFTC